MCGWSLSVPGFCDNYVNLCFRTVYAFVCLQTAASEAALAEARELAEIEAGQLSYNGYRMFTDDDGNIGDDDDSDLIEMLQDKDSASEQGKKGM